MKPAVLAALCALLLAPVAQAQETPPSDSAAPQVLVRRDGDLWTADYDLPADAPAWAFVRSALTQADRTPWRPGQWTVATPGVVLERHGHYDVLRAADGGPLPRRVRLVLRPTSVNLEADYNPAIVFSEGSAALFTGHFDLFPLSDPSQADALPADLSETALDIPSATVEWRDAAGPVLADGGRQDRAMTEGGAGYVLFGAVPVIQTPDLATAVDPALPSWIGEAVRGYAPGLIGVLAERLGPGPARTPAIFANWSGPTPNRYSMGGGTVDGLIVMSFEGDGLVAPNAGMADNIRWFVAHESAHFWLGQVVRYASARDAWITEGGADLTAVRANQALDPAWSDQTFLQTAVDDCVRLAVRPVATAGERGEHRAYYACGTVFALTAESASQRAGQGGWLDWARGLIEAERADGVVSRQDWLARYRWTAGDEAAALIEALTQVGAADPAARLARLFDLTGVAYVADGGALRLAPHDRF